MQKPSSAHCGSQCAAQHERAARARKIIPCPIQKSKRQRQRDQALGDFHGSKMADAPAGREITAENCAERIGRQTQRQKAQRGYCAHVADPAFGGKACAKIQRAGGKRAAHCAVKQPVQHGTAHAVWTAVAKFLCAQIQNGHARAGNAQRHRKAAHAQNELQKPKPSGADASGKIDLKQHRHPAQQHVHAREEHRMIKNGMVSAQNITLSSIVWTRGW